MMMLSLDILRDIFLGSVWSAIIWTSAFGAIGLTSVVEGHQRRERAKVPAGNGAVQPYDWQVHGL